MGGEWKGKRREVMLTFGNGGVGRGRAATGAERKYPGNVIEHVHSAMGV